MRSRPPNHRRRSTRVAASSPDRRAMCRLGAAKIFSERERVDIGDALWRQRVAVIGTIALADARMIERDDDKPCRARCSPCCSCRTPDPSRRRPSVRDRNNGGPFRRPGDNTDCLAGRNLVARGKEHVGDHPVDTCGATARHIDRESSSRPVASCTAPPRATLSAKRATPFARSLARTDDLLLGLRLFPCGRAAVDGSGPHRSAQCGHREGALSAMRARQRDCSVHD